MESNSVAMGASSPVKVSYPDLLAVKGVVEDLRAAQMTRQGVIVFNEVRKSG